VIGRDSKEQVIMFRISELPQWITQAALSVGALAACYLGGHFLRWIVTRRVRTQPNAPSGRLSDLIVGDLAWRIPLWAGILGIYLVAGFWSLPVNIENALEKTLFVLIAASLTFFTASVVTKLIVRYGSTLQHALPITSLTRNIARGVVITIGLLIIMNGLGLSITPILTALGVGGLAVALALQDTLANLFAGVYITIAGQLRVGDYVRLDSNQEGYITDIGWRSTRIRMLPNNLVLVPNAKLAQAIVTNFYLPERELSVLLEVGVDYDSDLTHVERVTCDVAKETLKSVPGGAAAFEPFIRYHTFGDSSINFTVVLRANEFVDQYLLKHEFIKRLHARYAREGITIPFPIRTLVQRQTADVPAAHATH
jgi:small-conductance mechanosensitive channel